MKKSLEQRVEELEKKVAELEGRVQAQPITIKFNGAEITKAISDYQKENLDTNILNL